MSDLQTHDISYYSGCKLAKFSTLPFSRSVSSSIAPFDLIHSNWVDPLLLPQKGGSIYYVSFIDDHTRYCWVYLLKRQSDFIHVYSTFHSFVKTQHFVVIKCFRCDLGEEYTSIVFFELLISDGIMHKSSYIDTPQQNGVVKRRHRHIIKTAHSLLLFASVLSVF